MEIRHMVRKGKGGALQLQVKGPPKAPLSFTRDSYGNEASEREAECVMATSVLNPRALNASRRLWKSRSQ